MLRNTRSCTFCISWPFAPQFHFRLLCPCSCRLFTLCASDKAGMCHNSSESFKVLLGSFFNCVNLMMVLHKPSNRNELSIARTICLYKKTLFRESFLCQCSCVSLSEPESTSTDQWNSQAVALFRIPSPVYCGRNFSWGRALLQTQVHRAKKGWLTCTVLEHGLSGFSKPQEVKKKTTGNERGWVPD